MISVKLLSKQVEKFAMDNAPAILTSIGAVGAVAASVLTFRATWEAQELITTERDHRHLKAMATDESYTFTKTDKVKLTWTQFILPAGVLTASVTSIVCANRVSAKRAAAMVAAYSLSTREYAEYREKVLEKFNANKERQVRDEIAQDHVTKNPPQDSQVIITGNGDVLCHDLPTGRYFKSNMEKIRSVVNDINAQVNEVGHATLSDLYVALGLTTTPYSEELGWTHSKLLDVHFSAVLTDESQPCISINYTQEPLRNSSLKGCETDPPF